MEKQIILYWGQLNESNINLISDPDHPPEKEMQKGKMVEEALIVPKTWASRCSSWI